MIYTPDTPMTVHVTVHDHTGERTETVHCREGDQITFRVEVPPGGAGAILMHFERPAQEPRPPRRRKPATKRATKEVPLTPELEQFIRTLEGES